MFSITEGSNSSTRLHEPRCFFPGNYSAGVNNHGNNAIAIAIAAAERTENCIDGNTGGPSDKNAEL